MKKASFIPEKSVAVQINDIGASAPSDPCYMSPTPDKLYLPAQAGSRLWRNSPPPARTLPASSVQKQNGGRQALHLNVGHLCNYGPRGFCINLEPMLPWVFML